MEFRVRLGYKNGVRIDRKEIVRTLPTAGELVVGRQPDGRRRAELLDEHGAGCLPALYDPVVIRVTEKYMEIGGVTEDHLPQSWILQMMPIEATKAWARQFADRPGMDLSGSAAHFHTGSPGKK